MFNKESKRYLSDDHLKNGDQVFESAFSNQGPEFVRSLSLSDMVNRPGTHSIPKT